MIKVTSSEARKDFAGMVNRARKGTRYLIHKHNKGIAAIVLVEDLALLEVIEPHRDLKAARRALEEIELRRNDPLGSGQGRTRALTSGDRTGTALSA